MSNKEKSWILSDSGRNPGGIFSSSELQQKYNLHEINGDTLCSPEGSHRFLVYGWEPLSKFFPDFKGNTEWLLQSPLTEAPCASGQAPFESDTVWTGSTDAGAPQSESQDEVAQLLRVVIANQERQIKSLKGIHWGIAAFAVLLLSRLLF